MAHEVLISTPEAERPAFRITLPALLAVLAAALAIMPQAGQAETPGNPAKGKVAFAICSGCHSVAGPARMGPPLQGVVGRQAGSVPNARYSAALAKAKFVWTPQKLDMFLADPRKMVPGTNMPYRVTDAAKRADIIAYLESLSKASGLAATSR